MRRRNKANSPKQPLVLSNQELEKMEKVVGKIEVRNSDAEGLDDSYGFQY